MSTFTDSAKKSMDKAIDALKFNFSRVARDAQTRTCSTASASSTTDSQRPSRSLRA
jgi:hypothetical protein